MPIGVKRIARHKLDGYRINGQGRATDVDIAIVDTGVSLHSDLNVVGGKNCIGGRKWNDSHGHGTHVAGTAAAKDNGFGVVGVAPGARIWSVKVLNKFGRGYVSWLLCGIDWVTAQRDGGRPLVEVANLSLRFKGAERPADDANCGHTIGDAVHKAICRSVAGGTSYVVAAGNDSNEASRYRPAAYSEVITVSALADFDGRPGGDGSAQEACGSWVGDRDDRIAKFSNYGAAVKIMAPGRCVWSTRRNGGYRQMSGTSMATPHVTGAVALYRTIYVDATPAQVRRALIACGSVNWFYASDPDTVHEPVLNIGRFCPPP
jgi:subtilisin family serine protease